MEPVDQRTQLHRQRDERLAMSPELFRKELERLMPNGDLRLVRDPRRLLMNLWVVERRIPRQEYLSGLEQLRQSGEDRYVHLTLGGEGRYYDTNPEWSVVHVVKTDTCGCDMPVWHTPECYREPDGRDIRSLHDWLYGWRDFEQSRDTIHREQKERQEKIEKAANQTMANELRTSKTLRGLSYSFAGDGSGSTTERI